MNIPNLPGMSRRKLLGASAAGAAAAAAGGLLARATAASASASTGPGGPAPAAGGLADAVFEAFRTHQLVGLGDLHQCQEHNDVLQTVLADPRLPEVVDDIVIETGNALYQDLIDRFILGDEPVNDADLRPVWRNTTQSPVATCDAPVFEELVRRVRAVNWPLPPAQRIRLLLGEPPIDWSKITNLSQLAPFMAERDSHPASVIEKEVLAKGRRALIHYGGEHLVHLNAYPEVGQSVATIIEQKTGVRAYVIIPIVPFTGDPGGLDAQLARYPRDTVIPTAGTWLGDIDAGDVMSAEAEQLKDGQPGQPYNPFCGIPLGTILDAGHYLGQPSVITASWPNPAVFLDPVYWAELQRRNAITGNQVDLETYRQQQPPLFPNPAPPVCSSAG
jgi:hypothetical protein